MRGERWKKGRVIGEIHNNPFSKTFYHCRPTWEYIFSLQIFLINNIVSEEM